MTTDSEFAILRRVIEPEKPELPAPLARMILRWQFSNWDRQQMHGLLEKAKRGTLTPTDRIQASNYERIGHFLSILKSKSRRSLKTKSNGS
jgi:hypothetical protein